MKIIRATGPVAFFYSSRDAFTRVIHKGELLFIGETFTSTDRFLGASARIAVWNGMVGVVLENYFAYAELS